MTVIPGQLALEGVDVDTRRMTRTEAGLSKSSGAAGASRLLSEMVRRGLPREHLHAAAALVLVLDEPREAG